MVPKAMEGMAEAQELKSLILVCCLLAGNLYAASALPLQHGSTQNRF